MNNPNPVNSTHKKKRTPFDRDRRETIYELHAAGWTIRQIVEQLAFPTKDGPPALSPRLNRKTALRDIAKERKSRAEESDDKIEELQPAELIFSNAVKRRAVSAGPNSRWVSEVVKAQERIDKIHGIG